MAKKLSEQNLISQEDFSRAKKMTKKDWNLCKAKFDELYNRINTKDKTIDELTVDNKKRVRDINDLSNMIETLKLEDKKQCKQFKAEIDKRDRDVKTWINRYNEVEALYERTDRKLTSSYVILITLSILFICFAVLSFFNGCI